MKSLSVAVCFVFLALALASGSCAQAPGVLKVGVMAPLTGPAASHGLLAYRHAVLEAERINNAGGVTVGGKQYQIELVPADTQGSPPVGVTAAEKLISQDKVKFILGPMSAPVYKSVASLLNDNKVIHLHWTVVAWSLGTDYPFGFRAYAMISEYIYPSWKFIAENYPDVKTVAIMTVDDEQGYLGVSLTKRACEEFGINVVEEVYISYGTREFYSLFAPVLAADPDIIDLTGLDYVSAAYLVKQLSEVGYTGDFHVSHQIQLLYTVSVAGAAAIEGYTCVGLPYETLSPRLLEQKEDYIERWGEGEYSEAGVVFLDALGLLVQGIEEADSLEASEVKSALEGMVYESPVFGTCEFGGYEWYGVNHQMIQPITMGKITNGNFVPIHEYDKDEVMEMLEYFYTESE